MPLKKTAKRDVRLIIILSEDELVAIEDYRFATRSPNRAAAARELLKIGMASKRQRETNTN